MPEDRGADLTVGLASKVKQFLLRIPRKRRLKLFLQLLPATLWVGFGVGIPMAMVFIFSFYTPSTFGYTSVFSLENYQELIRPTILAMIVNCFKYTVVVVPLALVAGYPVAYFLARRIKNKRLKMVLLLLAIIPFWTSYMIRMVTAIPLLGRNGILNNFFIWIGLTDKPFESLIYSEPSIWVVEAWLWIVFVIGPIYFSLSMINEDVIDAAKSLGANAWQVLIRVIFPLTYPGICAASVFLIVYTMGEVATTSIIGGNQYPILAYGILCELNHAQWPRGSAMSILLAIVTIIAVALLLRVIDLRKYLR
ncbi:MAG: ABC transporter permease [Pseudomonadota bacterium]